MHRTAPSRRQATPREGPGGVEVTINFDVDGTFSPDALAALIVDLVERTVPSVSNVRRGAFVRFWPDEESLT